MKKELIQNLLILADNSTRDDRIGIYKDIIKLKETTDFNIIKKTKTKYDL